MDDQIQSLINLLPAHWHTTALAAVVAVPVLGRAWHAWKSSGGLLGIWHALVFGTNTPKQEETKQP